MVDGDSSDGLIQRFQLLIWPDKPKKWSYEDRKKDAEGFKQAEDVYRRIAALDAENPLLLKFSEDAQVFFQEWLTGWMNTELRNDELNVSLESHFSKYRSLMPSLALLFSLADGNLDEVGLEHSKQAAEWCEYLKGHAMRVYSAQTSPDYSAALVLKKRIEQGLLGDKEGAFTIRNVYRKGWVELSTPGRARAAVGVLEDHCWVRPERQLDLLEEMGIVERGRPSEIYKINPEILKRIRRSETKPEADEIGSSEVEQVAN